MNLQQHTTGHGHAPCSSDETQSNSSNRNTCNERDSPSSPPLLQPQGTNANTVTAGTTTSSTAQQQQQQQQQQQHQVHQHVPDVVPHPNVLDILSGRGSGIFNHPGNRLFRRLVDANKPLYRACPRRLKPLLAQSIVDAMAIQHNSRFLKIINDGAAIGTVAAGTTGGAIPPPRWYNIGRAAAIAKTCQALREGGVGGLSSLTHDDDDDDNDEMARRRREIHAPNCGAIAQAAVVLSDSEESGSENHGDATRRRSHLHRQQQQQQQHRNYSHTSNSSHSSPLVPTVLDENDENSDDDNFTNHDSDDEGSDDRV